MLNALQRNYIIVKDVEIVYAIGKINHGKIEGGTSWGCNIAINNNIPTYLFDMYTNNWYFVNSNGFLIQIHFKSTESILVSLRIFIS